MIRVRSDGDNVRKGTHSFGPALGTGPRYTRPAPAPEARTSAKRYPPPEGSRHRDRARQPPKPHSSSNLRIVRRHAVTDIPAEPIAAIAVSPDAIPEVATASEIQRRSMTEPRRQSPEAGRGSFAMPKDDRRSEPPNSRRRLYSRSKTKLRSRRRAGSNRAR